MLLCAVVHKGSKLLSPFTGHYVKDMRKEFIEDDNKNKAIRSVAYAIYIEHREVPEHHVTPIASYMLIMSQSIISNIVKNEPKIPSEIQIL